MGITEIISNVISRDSASERFEQAVDSFGVNFILPVKAFDECKKGTGTGWMLHQYVYLKMLEEQGVAEQIRNGFSVPSSELVRLESDAVTLLELPQRFPGTFSVRVEGETSSDKFGLEIIPVLENSQREPVYKIKGPYLQFGENESYFLSAAQYRAFDALDAYKDATTTESFVKHNLRLVAADQQASNYVLHKTL